MCRAVRHDFCAFVRGIGRQLATRTQLREEKVIALINAFVPVLGDSFEIMTFSSRTADFTTIDGLDIGNGLMFELIYGPNSLTLLVVDP